MTQLIRKIDETHQLYIGDGVYVSFDGFNVWLRTERARGVHEIALEPAVWASLMAWHAELVKQSGKP